MLMQAEFHVTFFQVRQIFPISRGVTVAGFKEGVESGVGGEDIAARAHDLGQRH